MTINGEVSGAIEDGATKTFHFVPKPDRNVLVVSRWPLTSRELSFSASEGQVFEADCAEEFECWISLDKKGDEKTRDYEKIARYYSIWAAVVIVAGVIIYNLPLVRELRRLRQVARREAEAERLRCRQRAQGMKLCKRCYHTVHPKIGKYVMYDYHDSRDEGTRYLKEFEGEICPRCGSHHIDPL